MLFPNLMILWMSAHQVQRTVKRCPQIIVPARRYICELECIEVTPLNATEALKAKAIVDKEITHGVDNSEHFMFGVKWVFPTQLILNNGIWHVDDVSMMKSSSQDTNAASTQELPDQRASYVGGKDLLHSNT